MTLKGLNPRRCSDSPVWRLDHGYGRGQGPCQEEKAQGHGNGVEEKSTKTPARALIGFRPKKQFLLSVIPDLANLF